MRQILICVNQPYRPEDFLDPSHPIPPNARCEATRFAAHQQHSRETQAWYTFPMDPGPYCASCLPLKLKAMEFARVHRPAYLAMVAKSLAQREAEGWAVTPYTFADHAREAEWNERLRKRAARHRVSVEESRRWTAHVSETKAAIEATRARHRELFSGPRQPRKPEHWVTVEKKQRVAYTPEQLAAMSPRSRSLVATWARRKALATKVTTAVPYGHLPQGHLEETSRPAERLGEANTNVQAEVTKSETTQSLTNSYLKEATPPEDTETMSIPVHSFDLIVYKILHVPSGRVYVGGSTLGVYRWSTHKADAFFPDRSPKVYEDALHTLIRTEGQPSFRWEVLQECPDEETLWDRELYWIAYFMDRGTTMFNVIDNVPPGQEYGHGRGNPYIGKTLPLSPPLTKKVIHRTKRVAKIDATSQAIWSLMHAQGVTMTKIADAFGVSVACVHNHIGKCRPQKNVPVHGLTIGLGDTEGHSA